MGKPNERGIALVLALFLVAALSVLGASLMILSQTETYASMNYRMMSQARYAAESGVHKAANFLLDPTQYRVPTAAGTDPWANYNMTTSPVTCAIGCATTGPVVLSSDVSFKAANYPYAAAQTAFVTAFTGAGGTLAAGNISLSFKAYATLISMTKFDSYGGTNDVVQTWEVTADGGLTGSPKTTVEVVAIIETMKVAANPYAAFATANTCDAIYFHGSVRVDSYDSSQGPPGPIGCAAPCSTEATGGDIGSNGNVHVQGSVDVAGNVYTPRTGVGTCTAGAVTGLSGVIAGNMIPLPTDVIFPLPVFTATPPTSLVTLNAATLASSATTCSSLGLTLGVWPIGNCLVNAVTKTVTVGAGHGVDITLPNVVVDPGFTLTFAGSNTPGQNVNINSLTGAGTVEINANTTGVNNQSVVLKIAGVNPDGTQMAVPFDLSTMAWKQNAATTAFDASSFQIVYGGSANINMQGGNSQSAATVYAPNANFTMIGTQDFFGSILAKTIANGGNANIHYDRRLGRDYWVAGHPMIGSFTWKRY